ncbi:hypothetical protein [Candidatus Macondimonas diazotrophica]|uniref:Uncharacterized protein n=1 Tax=Candidatus Macondimonas diazotrophica TaxID=2305248 RepID=A0A4Z0F5H0_9GAMM|nr:hypothetical protein [Candidatus Macondimonas diazotrophica]TFZ81190.1 hypothetical protein E4680_13440 [Candidatus Macondimonas diazotrophica]
MTTTPWAHLPNARHIDAVLAYINERPRAASRVDWGTEWDVALNVVNSQLADIALPWRRAVRILDSVKPFKNKDADFGVLRSAARYAICALRKWDEAADLLDLPPDVLRTMADLAPEPVKHQAVLLLPWALVRASTAEDQS